MDHDLPYLRCYASDSEDDEPDKDVDEHGLTTTEVEAHKKVVGRDQQTSLFRDLSFVNKAKVDGGISILLVSRPSSNKDMKLKRYVINLRVKFQSLLEVHMWIKDIADKYHRPYKVVHSDVKMRYTIKCEEKGCSWVMLVRPFKGGPQWSILSCQSTIRAMEMIPMIPKLWMITVK
jgi:hypothetical protein